MSLRKEEPDIQMWGKVFKVKRVKRCDRCGKKFTALTLGKTLCYDCLPSYSKKGKENGKRNKRTH